MNTAKRQSARPGDYVASKKGGGVPAEVRAMARQLGLSMDEMPKVDEMWGRLDEAAESDPEAYARLMKASGKAMRKKQGEEVVDEDDEEEKEEEERVVAEFVRGTESLLPISGFVIKALGRSGKVMVNCCSHAALAPPTDAEGRPVGEEALTRMSCSTGLQIPMVVGEPRPCVVSGGSAQNVGDGLALDVVFNPWVLQRCENDRGFKLELAELALTWASQERPDLALETAAGRWKLINSKYKGGQGDSGDEPMPMPLAAAERQATAKPADRKKDPKKVVTGVTATPASLLDRLRTTQEQEEEETSIKLPSAVPTKKKPLVEEVLEMGDDGFDISSSPVKPAVKKGFLKSSAPLYPKGSEQGASTKEGTYSRFMSKCTVVDTTTMSPEEQQAAMEKHAGVVKPQQKKPAPSQPASSQPASSQEPAVKKGFFESKKKKEKEVEYDPDFDDLMKEADPEYSAASRVCAPAAEEHDETIAQLQDFANKLDFQSMYGDFGKKPKQPEAVPEPKSLSPAPLPTSTPEVEAEEEDKGGFKRGFFEQNNKQQKEEYSLTEIEAGDDGKRRLLFTAKVPGAKVFGDLKLDVAAESIKVVAKALKFNLNLVLPFKIDPNTAAAKFSKKNAKLTLTLTEVVD